MNSKYYFIRIFILFILSIVCITNTISCSKSVDPHNYDFEYNIKNVPVIIVNKSSISFSSSQNGQIPEDQNFTVTNWGEGTLIWSVSNHDTWLRVTVNTRGLEYLDSQTVKVSILTTNMNRGIYNGIITISSTNAGNSPQTISVTYEIL